MRIALLACSDPGRRLLAGLSTGLAGSTVLADADRRGVASLFAANWSGYDAFICVMASGIVVRAIAPLLGDKYHDPCVLVLDPLGRHVISLLSGHLGGGNALACRVAGLTGGKAVLTTASDSLDLVALDLWARGQGLVVERAALTTASARLVDRGELSLWTDLAVQSLPAGLHRVAQPEQAELLITPRLFTGDGRPIFRPRNLVVGVGCNRNTPFAEFSEALEELLAENGLCRASIRNLASIDKKIDEPGLLRLARSNGWWLDFFSAERLNTVDNLDISPAALAAVGAIGVAEPAALLSAGSDLLLFGKRKWKNLTMAIAQAPCTLSAQGPVPPAS